MGPRQLLIVDDDEVMIDLLVWKLAPLGHTLHTAADGAAGLAAARRLRPDLVLVDWMMPVMDGLTFCRAARAPEAPGAAELPGRLADTPIVLLTAKHTAADTAAGLAAGATVVLPKPVHPAELTRLVTRLLG